MSFNTEYEFHKFVVKYLQATKKFFAIQHIPNEGKRSYKERTAMKKLGVCAGFPDLFLIDNKGTTYFVEIKNCKLKNKPPKDWGLKKLSPSQQSFRDFAIGAKLNYELWYSVECVDLFLKNV